MTDFDKIVIEEFYCGQDKIPRGRLNKTHIDKIPEIKEYLDNRYPDSTSYPEIVYRIKNNLETRTVCPACGGSVKFYKRSFLTYCSPKCSAVNSKTKEIRKETRREKYGVDNVAQNDSVQAKIKEACLEKYGVEKCCTI